MAERHSDDQESVVEEANPDEVDFSESDSSNGSEESRSEISRQIELLDSSASYAELSPMQTVSRGDEIFRLVLEYYYESSAEDQILQSRQNCKNHSNSEPSATLSSAAYASNSTAGAEKLLDSYLCHGIRQILTRSPTTQNEGSHNVDATVQASPEMPGAEQEIQDDLWSRLSSFFLNFHAKIWFKTERTPLDEQLIRFTRYAVVDLVILVSRIIADICKLRQRSTALANECSVLTVLLAGSAMMIIISFFHVMDNREHEWILKKFNQRKNRSTSSGTVHELTERRLQQATNVNGCDTDHRWKLLYLTMSRLFDAFNDPKRVPCTENSSEFSTTNNTNTGVATKGTGMVDALPDTPAQSDSSKQGTVHSAAENLSSERIGPPGTIHTNETQSSQTQSESSTAAEEKSENESSIPGQYTAKDSVTVQKGKGSASGTQPEEACNQKFNVREPCVNIKSTTPTSETSQDPGPSTSYSNVRRENTRGAWINSTLEYVTAHLFSQSSGTEWKMGQSSSYVYTEHHTVKKSGSTEVSGSALGDLEQTGTTGMGGQKQESLDAKVRCESLQPFKTASCTPIETRASRRKRSDFALFSDSDNDNETLDSKSETKGKTSQTSLYRYKKGSKVQSEDEIGESFAIEAENGDSHPLKDRPCPRTPKPSPLGKRKNTEHLEATLTGTDTSSDAASDSSFLTYTKRQKTEQRGKSHPGEDYAIRRKRSEVGLPSDDDKDSETPDSETKGQTNQSTLCMFKKRSKLQFKDEINESSAVEEWKSDSPPLKDRLCPGTPKPSPLGKSAKAEHSEETFEGTDQSFDTAHWSPHTYVKRSKAEAQEAADQVLDSKSDDASIEAEESKEFAAHSTEASKADDAESSMDRSVKAETHEETDPEARSSMDRLKELCQDWETVLVIRGPADTEYVIHKIPDGESPIDECHDITPPPEVELVLKMLDIVNETNTRMRQAINYICEGKMEDYLNKYSAMTRLFGSFLDILRSAMCRDVALLEPFHVYHVFRENAKNVAKKIDPSAI